MTHLYLNRVQQMFLFVLSGLIIALANFSILGLITASVGFAIFWRVLLSISKPQMRFLVGFVWYLCIGLVQFTWFLSHPYGYIYGVWLFCAFLVAIPSAVISLFITPSVFKNISSLLALSGLWTLLEWSRLFVLSGLPFNPVGLSLATNLLSLQIASLGGIYALSFLVIFTNLLCLKTWIAPSTKNYLFAAAIAIFPYFFGFCHLSYHLHRFNPQETLPVLLVQPNFPIEENLSFHSAEETRHFVEREWEILLKTIAPYQFKHPSLIVFPENVVPFGTHIPMFPLDTIEKIFKSLFKGPSFPQCDLPDCGEYLIYSEKTHSEEPRWLVSNAYITKTIANTFNSEIVIGLEHSLYASDGKRKEATSSAFHFIPFSSGNPSRYDKQILVPMGEYIPFDWAQTLASKYGISGSFTPGKKAVLFCGKVPLGTSICYEELYGNLIRENRQKGAQLLVNLTNDGWYPYSKLSQQHFAHARLRTVENGTPLIRSCNTGVTAAIDSLGQVVAHIEENKTNALFVDVPMYHYTTLYSYLGDSLIILLSFCFLFVFVVFKFKKTI